MFCLEVYDGFEFWYVGNLNYWKFKLLFWV